MITPATTITTAEQLLKAGDIGRCELIRGTLRMVSPSGFPHGVAGEPLPTLRLSLCEVFE